MKFKSAKRRTWVEFHEGVLEGLRHTTDELGSGISLLESISHADSSEIDQEMLNQLIARIECDDIFIHCARELCPKASSTTSFSCSSAPRSSA